MKVPHKLLANRLSDYEHECCVSPYTKINSYCVLIKLRGYTFYEIIEYSDDDDDENVNIKFPILRELVRAKHDMIFAINAATDEQLAAITHFEVL